MHASPRPDPEPLLDRLEALVSALAAASPTLALTAALEVLAVPELSTAALNQGLLDRPLDPNRLLTVADHELIRLAPQVRALAQQGGFSAMKELALRLHQAMQ